MEARTFLEARECVVRTVAEARVLPAIEEVALAGAVGRVLARPIEANRDMPAVARSARDGFAVRAVDCPGNLEIIGEVRAGHHFSGTVGAGQSVEIMTGAPVPDGADAVVMVEYVRRNGLSVYIDHGVEPRQMINARACEALAGQTLLHAGQRLGYAEVALLAAFGCVRVPVFQRIHVAILSTGDELVDASETPDDYQIRNSNAWALAVQVERAGAIPEVLPIARDTVEETRAAIERGHEADLLLLSGGVSAGKYDVVERALHFLGAEFYFDSVLIQPGRPLVFGRLGERFFFGLPGNPASTMVTFEVLARAAVELLSGQDAPALHMPYARLTHDFRQRPGLTRFLPACLTAGGTEVTPLGWSGSGDIPALTRANCYLVSDPERPEYPRGELIRVLLK